MTDKELEQFETELRAIAPSPVPEHLLNQLRAIPGSARSEAAKKQCCEPAGSHWWTWWTNWRWWFAGATACAAAAVLALAGVHTTPANPGAGSSRTIQVDHSLVSAFDAVAELPNGEPVRFRCRKWMDDVRLIDSSGGLLIEQSSPRVEVIPVRFETY